MADLSHEEYKERCTIDGDVRFPMFPASGKLRCPECDEHYTEDDLTWVNTDFYDASEASGPEVGYLYFECPRGHVFDFA